MPQMDRATARALTEAGYMPLAEYIRAFGGAPVEIPRPVLAAVAMSRPLRVSAHFEGPVRPARYGVSYQRKRRA